MPAYTAQLRKVEPAYLFEARPELARAIEERTFSASYKGVTDLVTKWVWPRPAAWVTRRLAAWHVHPNTVTIASWLLAALACWLFARGAFVAGLLAAWLMTFLDTVDGKLARVTLTSSRFGNVLDHSLDLIHPPFWYLAWGHTLPASPRVGDRGRGRGLLRRAAARGHLPARLQDGVALLAPDRLAVPHHHRAAQPEPDLPERGGARGAPRPRPGDGGPLDDRLLRLPRRPPASRPSGSAAAAA